MNYRRMERTGDRLSLLGYGCMRFPRKNGAIDEARTRAQILRAVEGGVNYFDTAYLYPGSEKALGNILASEGLRDRVKIADKLPHMLVKKEQDLQAILEKQLNRLRTDRIDYYLVHNIGSFADWEHMRERGFEKFAEQERSRGRIVHVGFSFHGNAATFRQVVDDYPWDFCQIQYNYLDENFQAGARGLAYAAEKGLGVIVMEPLRGGMLGAKMPQGAREILRECGPQDTPARWALRWVFAQPGIQVVLSGMNEDAHVEENLALASQEGDYVLTDAEQAAIARVQEYFRTRIKVPCTACAYCMPCPHGVDIPTCFSGYNDHAVQGGLAPAVMYLQATLGTINGKPSGASLCRDCGVCVGRCPQQIDIPRHLREVVRTMERPWLRLPMQVGLRLLGR